MPVTPRTWHCKGGTVLRRPHPSSWCSRRPVFGVGVATHPAGSALAWPEILGTCEGGRCMGARFPERQKNQTDAIVPRKPGLPAQEGRGQGPARSFPEANSSVLPSCFRSLLNKGETFALFGLVYFKTFSDEGQGLKGTRCKRSTWMLFPKQVAGCSLSFIPVTLERPCRPSERCLPTCCMSLAGHFNCNLMFSTLMRM